MIGMCKKIAENEGFQRFILFLILLTAASMGLEAVPYFAETYGSFLFILDAAIQTIFVFEITVRLIAHIPHISTFFHNRWNTFDFTVIVLSLIPGIGSFALIARLLRVLRILRVFSASDRLRCFIDRLQRGFDEVFFFALIAAILGYIFTIAGHYLFASIDPAHWGDLRQSVLSVFYLMLLQDVQGVIGPLTAKSMLSLLFFAAFYITFIGLVISTIAAAIAQEQERKK